MPCSLRRPPFQGDRLVGGRGRSSAGGRRGLLLTVALVRLMATDGATGGRAKDAVAGDMTGDTTDDGALEAALRLCAGGADQGSDGQNCPEQNGSHGDTAFR